MQRSLCLVSLLLSGPSLKAQTSAPHSAIVDDAMTPAIKGVSIAKSLRWDADAPERSSARQEEPPTAKTYFPIWPLQAPNRIYTPYVQNIVLIAGNEATIPCPLGFGKIDLDLNQFAGGPYIFICYGKTDGLADDKGVIESVAVEAAAFENQLAWDQGCRLEDNGVCISYYVRKLEPSDGDMNQGAGGDFLYLAKNVRPCQNGACEPGASPDRFRLRELAVVSGDTMDIPCPTSYSKIPIDLNQGSRGAHIFLCQMLKLESPFD